MRNTSLAAIIAFGGLLLCICAAAHFFLGFPIINKAMAKDNTGQEVSDLLSIIWVFSSVMLLLCGVWGMFIGVSIRKNLRYTKKQALSLGIGMSAFGIYGFTHPFPSLHLGVFLAIGLIILIPSLFLSKEQGPYH
jgi:hypothetical protein